MHADLIQIYGLFHPDTDELRYIGKAKCSQKRLASHMRDSRRRKTPLYSWIKSLVDQQKKPVCKVLIEIAPEYWKDAEMFAISTAKDEGFRLLNVAEGGDEPYCSIEVRRENGRRVAAIRDDKKMRSMLFLSSALRNGQVSPATKEKMRNIPELFARFSRYL